MPSLTQLKYAVAVADLGHFGRAADSCFVSQPSLSIQIQKIEDELGYPLFDRTTKPISVTSKGHLYLEQARQVLRAHDELAQLGKKTKGEISGPFRLGLIPTVGPYLLPLFIEEFSNKYPKVDLTVDEVKTEQSIEQIRHGKLDAAILSTPLHEPQIIERPLYLEPFYLYVSESSSLIDRKRVSQRDLDPKDLWLLQEGHCFKNQVVNYCKIGKQGQVFPSVKFEGGSLETLRYMIQTTKGYSLFPYLFIDRLSETERDSHVKSFAAPTPSREISLVFSKAQWKTDILEALEESIREALPKKLKELQSKNLEIMDI